MYCKEACILVILNRTNQVDDLFHNDKTQRMNGVAFGFHTGRDRPVGDLDLSFIEQAVVNRSLDVGVNWRGDFAESVGNDA